MAPGSRVVTSYLEKSGLDKHLNNLGFNTVGFGCTTCIGNSGPLDQDISEEIDFIFHFASAASPIAYQENPVNTLKAGSIGTINTLGLAKVKKAAYLLASTSEIYGDPEVSPQSEEYWGNVNPNGERSMYDEAKRFAEPAVATN